MRSGLFGTEGLTKAAPCGFEKITEGTTALLFPPANVKGVRSEKQCGNCKKKERGDSSGDDNAGNNNNNNNNNNSGYQKGAGSDEQAVFYNPAQVVNRDLSVCVLACFSRLRRDEPRRKGGTRLGITILEALSATGLRAIRYFKELSDVRFIIANDLDPGAVECIRRNCEFNAVPCVEPTLTENFPSDQIQIDDVTGTVTSGGAVIPNLDDANDLMFRLATNTAVYAGRRICAFPLNTRAVNGGGAAANFNNISNDNSSRTLVVGGAVPLLQQELVDVVDLDPYGSASPFLDAAMRCIKEGGLLLVTSTDSAILCGNYPETCHAKYNTMPVKNAACHEMAVRILLAAIERVSNKHQKYIVPLLSLHIDFYVRCFVRVYTQPAEAKLSSCKLGYLLQCSNCPAYWVRPLAVAQTRSNKRLKKEKTSFFNYIDRKYDDCTTDDHNQKENTVGDNDSTTMEPTCNIDNFGRECFSEVPLRQNNPKITCCGLKHLPPFVDGNSCTVCGAYVSLSGPIYAAPTHSFPFLKQLLREVEKRGAAKKITSEARIAGLIRVAMEELQDVPLFYKVADVASFVKVQCPSTPGFVGALQRMGYRVSQVHCAPSGIKTDCPPDVLVAVMLRWKEEARDKHKHEATNLTKDTDYRVGSEVVKAKCFASTPIKETTTQKHMGPRVPIVTALGNVDFSYDRRFDFRGAVTGVTKFIPNAPNWGPKRRHRGVMHKESFDES